ncbi:MAG: hypothetical protein ACLGP3_11495 [Acidobacteriota bacterium]
MTPRRISAWPPTLPRPVLTPHLAPSLHHEVEALDPCVFLLTLSWPESEKLRHMPHRGYGS